MSLKLKKFLSTVAQTALAAELGESGIDVGKLSKVVVGRRNPANFIRGFLSAVGDQLVGADQNPIDVADFHEKLSRTADHKGQPKPQVKLVKRSSAN
jgi:hypothetical protein